MTRNSGNSLDSLDAFLATNTFIIGGKMAKISVDSNINICNVKRCLSCKGITVIKQISCTLQGRIYLCKINNKFIVAKVASMLLHRNGITNTIPGKYIKVKENIIKEIKIIKYLQHKKPPKGI